MQGAAARHTVDGDLSSYVDTCQPGSRDALCACNLDTSVVGNNSVTYFISNPRLPSGASVTRTIVVYPVCLADEDICADLTCSSACVAGVLNTAGSNTSPTIFFPDWQQHTMHVAQGTDFTFCGAGNDHYQQDVNLCEPGIAQWLLAFHEKPARCWHYHVFDMYFYCTRAF